MFENRKQKIVYFITCVFVATLLCAVIVQAQQPTFTTFLYGGSMSETADYVIFLDGSSIYVKHGKTGEVTYGGTDIGAVINTYVDLLPTTGGKIYIKSGEYNQYTTINLQLNDAHTTLAGEGYKTQTIFETQNDIFALNLTGYGAGAPLQHCFIKNIKFEAGVTSTCAGIFLQWVGGCKFENLAIDDFSTGIDSDTGLTANLITQCSFKQINIYQPLLNGMVLQDTYDNRLTDVYVLDAKGAYGSSYAGITLIHAYGGDILQGCLTLNGLGHGIQIIENSVWTELSNCISDHNEGHNIVLSEAMGTQLTNCWGGTSLSTSTYGILIDTCNDTMISNSQFRTNYAHGVQVLDSENTQIMNVLATTNGQGDYPCYGISIEDSYNTVVTGCILDNRDTGGGFNATAQAAGINENAGSYRTTIIGCDSYGMGAGNGIFIAGTGSHCNLSYNGTSWVS